MNKLDIIRAWKDELFRKSLTSEQQALLPEHPAGEMGLSEEELARVHGGVKGPSLTDTINCATSESTCTGIPCTA